MSSDQNQYPFEHLVKSCFNSLVLHNAPNRSLDVFVMFQLWLAQKLPISFPITEGQFYQYLALFTNCYSHRQIIRAGVDFAIEFSDQPALIYGGMA